MAIVLAAVAAAVLVEAFLRLGKAFHIEAAWTTKVSAARGSGQGTTPTVLDLVDLVELSGGKRKAPSGFLEPSGPSEL